MPFLSDSQKAEFMKFHDELQKHGFMNSLNLSGKIMVIDQDVTLMIMELYFERLGVKDRVSYF